ncbi:FKBP-type peptidyl-prolyl cis-trans isomerase [Microbacterium sp. GXF7504]
MRKLPAVLTAAGLVAVTLTGCSAGSPTCDRDVSDDRLGDIVDVSGAVGELPELSVPTPFHASGVEITDLAVGDGTAIVSDWQDVVLGISVVDGDTGEVLIQQGYQGLDSVTSVSTWTGAIPGLEDALMCATSGTRMLVGLDAEELGQAGQALGVSDGASALIAIDVRKVYLSAADGADQFNSGFGLPAVVRAPGGQPGVVIPDAPAPTEPVVQVLKKGDGQVTAAEDSIRINYTSVAWETREVGGTSWGAEPYVYDLSGYTDPLTTALIGQPVGSQLMVVLPPAEGASGDTQVFVVDILGIDGQAD